MVKIRVLGLSGTPIKDGNCDKLVQHALKITEEFGDVETEFITTADKEIRTCIHCQWCIENRAPCRFDDDAHEIFDRMEKCDGLILGSPVWFNTLAPFLQNLMSRARYQAFFTNNFRNCVVGFLTLGFLGFGMEHSLDTMSYMFTGLNMIQAGKGSALGTTRAYGQRPAYLEHGVLDDKWGMIQTRAVATRVVEVTRMVKYAEENDIGIPKELRLTSTFGKVKERDKKVFVDNVWRDK